MQETSIHARSRSPSPNLSPPATFTNIQTKRKNRLPIKSIYPISNSTHDPLYHNFLNFIRHNDSKKKKQRKETNYVPSNRHTHPKAPFILLLIPFSDPKHHLISSHHRHRFNHRLNSSGREDLGRWTQPLRGRGDHRAVPFLSFFPLPPSPKNIRGTARLNSTGRGRVKRNWPRRRPFRGRETSRFHAGKGYGGGQGWAARRILMRCPPGTPKPPLSFFGCTRRRHRYFSREKRRWGSGGGGDKESKTATSRSGRARTTQNGPLAKI